MGETMYVVKMYNILLQIVHFVYSLIQKIRDVCSYLVLCMFKFCCHEIEEFDQVYAEIKQLYKVPRHIVILIGSEKPSYADLAKIIVWCVASGIPFISFYDHNGTLKKTKTKLNDAIEKASLKYDDGLWKKTITNGNIPVVHQENEFNSPTSSIRINVFSLSDGRGAIADLAKECAERHIPSSQITTDFIDIQLQQKFGSVPDPDLALCFGQTLSTYGLLPWQIRVTEFMNIKSHHGIDVNLFMSSLRLFAFSEQRFGK